MSATRAHRTPRTVGTPIAATGGYFECRTSFDPDFTPAASFIYPFQYWPAFWIEDIDLWLAINDRNPAIGNKPELDFFEYFSRSIGYGMDMHDWTNNVHSAGLISSVVNASLGSPGFQKMNTFGTLWVPQGKNSGTGIVRRYFNGKHIAAADVTYSSTTTSPRPQEGFPVCFRIWIPVRASCCRLAAAMDGPSMSTMYASGNRTYPQAKRENSVQGSKSHRAGHVAASKVQ